MRNKYQLLKIFITLLLLCELTIGQKVGSWYDTDSMHERRMNHAGIQLDNGNILITGGYTPRQENGSNEAELFDIKTHKWSMSIPMNQGRAYHEMVKLKDGSILAIGGFSERSCEILSSDYSKWTFTDSIKTRKYWGSKVVVLKDGDVLVIGGTLDTSSDTTGALKECELFDYESKKWEYTQVLNTGRYDHTATLLNDGKVLIAGGKNIYHGVKLLNTCEIYDPITKQWNYIAPMHYPRAGHSATLLPNNKVLVIGGQQSYSELYDPMKNQWEVLGKVYLASGQNTANILDENNLLLVNDTYGYLFNCGWETYSFQNHESTHYEKFNRTIREQIILKLDNYSVLVAGGEEILVTGDGVAITPTNYCQIYDLNLTSIGEVNNRFLPKDYYLSNYPNPFNGFTNIIVELGSAGKTILSVYNALGETMKTIYNGELEVGTHSFQLDLNNYSSGVYFVGLSSSNNRQFIKIIHQK
ncbi:MAG: kelch repeat-containing protein [Melioribacteraceae bacterium]